MLDEICWRVYGTTSKQAVEKTLLLNQGLADYGPTLPAGVLITLPDAPLTDTTQSAPDLSI